MLGEAGVFLVGTRGRGQIAQALDVILESAATAFLVGAFVGEPIAPAQRRREQVDDLLRKDCGRALVLVPESARTPQRMVDALLMGHVLETVVGRETIVSHA